MIWLEFDPDHSPDPRVWLNGVEATADVAEVRLLPGAHAELRLHLNPRRVEGGRVAQMWTEPLPYVMVLPTVKISEP